jgi:hypothetical protein
MLRPRTNHSAVDFAGKTYAAGGEALAAMGEPFITVERYDGQRWEAIAPVPSITPIRTGTPLAAVPVASVTLCCCDDSLCLIEIVETGGIAGEDFQHALAALVAGGEDPGADFLAAADEPGTVTVSIWRYDVAKDRWDAVVEAEDEDFFGQPSRTRPSQRHDLDCRKPVVAARDNGIYFFGDGWQVPAHGSSRGTGRGGIIRTPCTNHRLHRVVLHGLVCRWYTETVHDYTRQIDFGRACGVVTPLVEITECDRITAFHGDNVPPGVRYSYNSWAYAGYPGYRDHPCFRDVPWKGSLNGRPRP